jgi:hypothetical protein
VLDGINNLFTCQFLWLTVTEGITEFLNLFFVKGTFLWVHHVGVHRLLEDVLGDLEVLVGVSLDDLGGKLFPVGSLQNKFLTFFDILVLNSLTTFDGMLGKAVLGEVVRVFNN